MPSFESPFLAVPVGDWLCSNDLTFAIFDQFPVSPGHLLVTTRRIVETWFDATDTNSLDNNDRFTRDSATDSYTCPQGKTLSPQADSL